MVRVPAFQAGYAGSIPVTRSSSVSGAVSAATTVRFEHAFVVERKGRSGAWERAMPADGHSSKHTSTRGLVLPMAVSILSVCGLLLAHKYLGDTPRNDQNLKSHAQLDGWMAVLSVVVAYGAGLGAYFWRRLSQIARLYDADQRPWWARFGWASVTSGVSVVAVLVSTTLLADRGSTQLEHDFAPRIAVLRTVVVLLSLPAQISFFVIRAVATDDSTWTGTPLNQLQLLLMLRRELRRLLGVLGVLLTLIVVATGLRRQAFMSLDKTVKITPESVLLYGMVFLIWLGLLYIVANTALDDRSEDLLQSYAPLPSPDGSAFVDELERYRALGALIGVGAGWRTFEAGVLIAAPLLTGLIGLLTHS